MQLTGRIVYSYKLSMKPVLILILLIFSLEAFGGKSIPFGGKLSVNAVNFNGSVGFSFAILDSLGETHWRSADANETISILVENGHYSVFLGGKGMNPLPVELFLEHQELSLQVSCDFGDGAGLQLLEENHSISAHPYALTSELSRNAFRSDIADSVANGSITLEALSDSLQAKLDTPVDVGSSSGHIGEDLLVTRSMLAHDVLGDLNRTVRLQDLSFEVSQIINRLITRDMLSQGVLNELNATITRDRLSANVRADLNRTIGIANLSTEVTNKLNQTFSIDAGSITLDQLSQQVRDDINRTITRDRLSSDILSDINRPITKSMLSQEVLDELNASVGPSKLSSEVSNALKPMVVGQPSSVVRHAGMPTYLVVDATGSDNSYQWKKNGAVIVGATNRTLSISDLNASQHEGNYSVVVSNAFGTAISSVAQIDVNNSLTEGLVGWWKFDETSGAVAHDSSGNGNDGNLTNGPSWTEGKIGGALSFDGLDDKVVLTNQSYPTGNNASLSFWAYGGEDLPNQTQVFISKDSANQRLFNVHLSWVSQTGEESYIVVWDIGSPSGENRISQSGVSGDFQGSWRHWSFTKDHSLGEMIIFKDGSAFHRATDKFQPSAETSDIEYFWVGVAYHGLLDDVRIYDRALSAVEVKALYELGGQPVQESGSGTNTVADGSITASKIADQTITTNQLSEQILKYLKPEITQQPTGAAIFADSNHTISVSAEGKYLTYQWKKNGANLAGETNPSLTITDANATQHEGNYSVVVSNDFGSVESADAEILIKDGLLNGLIAWWKFDETSGVVAYDSSGNGHDANLTNGPTWVTGKIGGALSFDGTDDMVRTGLSGMYNQDFTWSTWIKTSNTFGAVVGVSADSWSNGGTSFYMQSGKPKIDVCNIGNKLGSTSINTNQWIHYLLTVEDSGGSNDPLKIFVNGQIDIDSQINWFGFSGQAFKLRIGHVPVHGNYYLGQIDDVRIYDRVLSAAEAQALYQLGQ